MPVICTKVATRKSHSTHNFQKLEEKYTIRKINLKTQFIPKDWGKGRGEGGAKGERGKQQQ